MMTANLPATFIEAEALANARQWIAAHREPGGIFHPDAEREYGREMMKQHALGHPFGCDEIVYFAENGSKEADLALREIIAERVERGEPLGAVLGAYNIRLLNPLRPRRHGPPRTANFVRDCGISLLVALLMKHFGQRVTKGGLPATWKPAKPASISSVAAEALTEAKIDVPLGAKGVERIWLRYRPAAAGIFPELRFPEAGYGGLFEKS